jgi:hydrogenase maturation protein HypF
MRAAMAVRAQVVVRGIVQGVGFRPFVYRLARERSLGGWVLNSTQGVVIEVEGERESIDGFLCALQAEPPPQALIEKVETNLLPPVGYSSFVIEASRDGSEFVLVSPDICICADCLRELGDPDDPRYRYPFINCTNCGPRFTIISDIPYDRPKTTMRVFAMCPRCDREYHDPVDRRFHAQPNACPVCGPRVALAINGARAPETAGDAIETARRLLAEGAIVSVKGLGGFHLACDATNRETVATLRRRKHRIDKPFAVMSLDVATVRRYCEVQEGEAQLLESPARPIVLLRRLAECAIAPEAAPGNSYLGVMLPYTPLHYLLLGDSDTRSKAPLALVMTSGNMSEEPIAIGNEEARERLSVLADYFLAHDRDIHVRCDDSVTRLFRGKESILRRSRGYAPFPVRLNMELAEVLACGAELKNTFCLTKGTYAFLSQHIGDMENYETFASYQSSVQHFQRLFRVEPRAVAYDMHPNYLATRYALELAEQRGLRKVPVQHHHAHVASCMAENGVTDPVIGVAFDGTGYGMDGRIWGGEFLLADFRRFRRLAHFKYVPLPGGETAIKRPYRMAVSHLLSALGDEALDLPLTLWSMLEPGELALVRRLMATGVNSPLTSSCGRLFDAVSALVGVRGVVNYEGQAAIELEMLAAEGVDDTYDWKLQRRTPMIIDPAPLLRGVVADLRAGVEAGVISARFHNTVGAIVADVCSAARQKTRVERVALSGGCFQNVYLLGRTIDALESRGFDVLTHHLVPANDGGIALGQAVIANARLSGKER